LRLEHCILSFDAFVSAPLVRNEPEEEWVRARDSGAIPDELYEIYRRAHYLSFGSAPVYLKDIDNVLFSYFGMLLRSLLESLVDSDAQLRSFVAAQADTYDAGKKIRGEVWDPGADARARRHFRDLLIALQSSLDAFADLVALLLTGRIAGLRVGRAQFARIEDWLRRPMVTLRMVLTPYEEAARRLFKALDPLVNSTGPERDWLPLMRLFRNKAAHLGQPVFRQIGLHDSTPKFYTFIPRQWPYIWERNIKPHGSAPPSDPDALANSFRESLIHEDIESYASGVRAKVQDVIRAGLASLSDTYSQFRDFRTNRAALAELEASSESYQFEYFIGSQAVGPVDRIRLRSEKYSGR
jgi:hypothetical protein